MRRAPGEGSVYRCSGRPKPWVAQLYLGRDDSGKRQLWRSYHTLQREAVQALHEAIQDRDRGHLVVSSRSLLKDYLTQWLQTVQAEPKWRAELVRYVDKHIIPGLGQHSLKALTPALIQRWMLDLHGHGPYWLQKCLGVLRHALNDAVVLELIATNPAAHVKAPKAQKRDLVLWSPAQVKTFLQTLRDDDDRELYVVAIASGCRAGELLALTWPDVSFERRCIAIQRSVGRVTGLGLLVTDAKSGSSRRLVALPAVACAALMRQQTRLIDWAKRLKWQEHGLVFPKRDGCHRTDEGPRRKLQRVAAELGFPVLTFHHLRHLHASLAIAAGVSAKALQARLGHADVRVTLDVYSHLWGSEDRAIADRFEDRLGESLT